MRLGSIEEINKILAGYRIVSVSGPNDVRVGYVALLQRAAGKILLRVEGRTGTQESLNLISQHETAAKNFTAQSQAMAAAGQTQQAQALEYQAKQHQAEIARLLATFNFRATVLGVESESERGEIGRVVTFPVADVTRKEFSWFEQTKVTKTSVGVKVVREGKPVPGATVKLFGGLPPAIGQVGEMVTGADGEVIFKDVVALPVMAFEISHADFPTQNVSAKPDTVIAYQVPVKEPGFNWWLLTVPVGVAGAIWIAVKFAGRRSGGLGDASEKKCPTCIGKGRVWSHVYRSKKGKSMPPKLMPCPSCAKKRGKAKGRLDGIADAIEEDRTSSGHERLTCECGKALVRQPHMSKEKWEQSKERFLEEHATHLSEEGEEE